MVEADEIMMPDTTARIVAKAIADTQASKSSPPAEPAPPPSVVASSVIALFPELWVARIAAGPTIAVAEKPSTIIIIAKEIITIRPIFADFLAATADGTV